MKNVSVKVLVESFEGYITANGEHIHKCKRGDIISVREETWRNMQAIFPEWFCLPHIQPSVFALNKNTIKEENTLSSKNPRFNRGEIYKREEMMTPPCEPMLRILYLYHDNHRYRYDFYLRELPLNIPFIKSGSSVFMYGLNAHNMYPNETPIIYDENITLQELTRYLSIDVILIAQKSRMFWNYHPPLNFPLYENKSWLNGLNKVTIPKIVIEEDYHYEKDDSWYIENGVNLILQRHYSQYLRQSKVRMEWLPFSVNTTLFHPSDKERKNKICFTGSFSDDTYKIRREASLLLQKEGLCDVFSNKEKVYKKYVDNLQEYISHICCGSSFEICPAKSFEIMASGSVLLTNRYLGIDKLFPENSYFSYKLPEVLSTANIIIKNKKLREEVVTNALNCIKEKHTDEIRTKELIQFISEVVK